MQSYYGENSDDINNNNNTDEIYMNNNNYNYNKGQVKHRRHNNINNDNGYNNNNNNNNEYEYKYGKVNPDSWSGKSNRHTLALYACTFISIALVLIMTMSFIWHLLFKISAPHSHYHHSSSNNDHDINTINDINNAIYNSKTVPDHLGDDHNILLSDNSNNKNANHKHKTNSFHMHNMKILKRINRATSTGLFYTHDGDEESSARHDGEHIKKFKCPAGYKRNMISGMCTKHFNPFNPVDETLGLNVNMDAPMAKGATDFTNVYNDYCGKWDSSIATEIHATDIASHEILGSNDALYEARRAMREMAHNTDSVFEHMRTSCVRSYIRDSGAYSMYIKVMSAMPKKIVDDITAYNDGTHERIHNGDFTGYSHNIEDKTRNRVYSSRDIWKMFGIMLGSGTGGPVLLSSEVDYRNASRKMLMLTVSNWLTLKDINDVAKKLSDKRINTACDWRWPVTNGSDEYDVPVSNVDYDGADLRYENGNHAGSKSEYNSNIIKTLGNLNTLFATGFDRDHEDDIHASLFSLCTLTNQEIMMASSVIDYLSGLENVNAHPSSMSYDARDIAEYVLTHMQEDIVNPGDYEYEESIRPFISGLISGWRLQNLEDGKSEEDEERADGFFEADYESMNESVLVFPRAIVSNMETSRVTSAAWMAYFKASFLASVVDFAPSKLPSHATTEYVQAHSTNYDSAIGNMLYGSLSQWDMMSARRVSSRPPWIRKTPYRLLNREISHERDIRVTYAATRSDALRDGNEHIGVAFVNEYCGLLSEGIMGPHEEQMIYHDTASDDVIRDIKHIFNQLKQSAAIMANESNAFASQTDKARMMKKINAMRLVVNTPDTHSRRRHVPSIRSFARNVAYIRSREIRKHISAHFFYRHYHIGHNHTTAMHNDRFLEVNNLVPNAFYDSSVNTIYVRLGILRFPYYMYTFNHISKIARIGFVLAHEISHAFDPGFANYNHHGTVQRGYISEASISNILNRMECLRFVYALKTPYGNYDNNPDSTIKENFADILGMEIVARTLIRKDKICTANHTTTDFRTCVASIPEGSNEEAYYNKIVKRIMANHAQMMCQKLSPTEEYMMLQRDTHSLFRFRVEVPILNLYRIRQKAYCIPL